MVFSEERRGFVVIGNSVIVQRETERYMECRVWMRDCLNLGEEFWDTAIRGYIAPFRIQFLIGEDYSPALNVTAELVNKAVDAFTHTFPGCWIPLICNGVKRGKEGETWDPVLVWNRNRWERHVPPKMRAIAIVDEHYGLGYKGEQPIVIPADRERFRELTMGSIVVMGRKTALALPGQKPLEGRRNIVLSRRSHLDGFINCTSIEELFKNVDDDSWVIGGGELFHQLYPYLTDVYLTQVRTVTQCDTFFPTLPRERWDEQEAGEWTQDGEYTYRFAHYVWRKLN